MRPAHCLEWYCLTLINAFSQAAAAQSDLRLVTKSVSSAASTEKSLPNNIESTPTTYGPSASSSSSSSSSTSSSFLYPELVTQLAAAHHRASALLSDTHRLQVENHALTRQAMDATTGMWWVADVRGPSSPPK